MLTGNVALRNRLLDDRPNGLAGRAVEHIEKAVFAGLGHDIYVLPVLLDGGELRRSSLIVVPEIMVNHLEMPNALAGARVEREDTIAEQVVTLAIGAIEIVCGRAGGEIDEAALFVHRHISPGIVAAYVFPSVLWIRFVAEFAGVRHGVKLPYEFAGNDIVSANIARRGYVAFTRRGAENHQVLEDLSRASRLYLAD